MGDIGVNRSFGRAEVDRPDLIKRRGWVRGPLREGTKRDEPGDVFYRATSFARVFCAAFRFALTRLPSR